MFLIPNARLVLFRFRLLFAWQSSTQRIRNSTGRLLVERLCRWSPAPPLKFRERSSADVYPTFRLNIEHVSCVSVRAVCNRCPGETNALAQTRELSRQRASSRSRWGAVSLISRIRPGLTSNHSKALGISGSTEARGQLLGFEEGVRVCLGVCL